MNKIKKFMVFILIAIVISFVGCTPVSKEIEEDIVLKSEKDQVIYITSDLHYLSDTLTDHGEAYEKYISSGDGKQLEYMDEIIDAFAYNIKNSKPDILILSGDLTCNGEKESHLGLAQKLKAIEKSGTSVYVIPGNHDISNPWARSFKEDKQYLAETVDATDFSQIYSDFGYEEAISKDADTLSYLAAPSKEVWLLMLDTNKYKDNLELGSPRADGIIGKSTSDWIQDCCDLAKEKGATIITVMHHNILNHSEVVQEGYTLNNHDQMRILFKENHLNLVFSGHIHVQDISSDQRSAEPLYDIASNALSVNPHQYGILNYIDQDVSFEYNTAKVDVESWAKSEGIKDENLKNFTKFSEDYFGKLSYDRAYKSLLKETDYSKEEIAAMAETMSILNIRYFAGVENLNETDLINSDGYNLLMNLSGSFHLSYASSIVKDDDTDDNHLVINMKR